MSYSYQPLADGEIRLISFEHHSATADLSPIRCTVEHVWLGSESVASHHQRFKGSNLVWPELSAHHDTASLFRKGKDPYSEAKDLPCPSDSSATTDESSLPWRHQWGDFIALSYSWGSPLPELGITINGAPFKVRRNLYDALIQLRQCERIRQGFKLWIDAISINQADLVERAHQVTRMRHIYQSAWQVVVWTGPEADDSSLALTALHWLACQYDKVDPFEGFYKERQTIDARPLFISWPSYKSPLRETVHSALFHFFSRAYWQRMWIIQEIAAGTSNTPVLCGGKCISWGDLYKASQTITRDSARLGRDIINSSQQQTRLTWPFDIAQDRQPAARAISSERLWKIQIAMMNIQTHQRSEGISNWNSLVQSLILVRDASLSEERDRVYGILGIKSVADSILWQQKADYKISIETLYIAFTSAFIAAGNLSILRLVSRCAGPLRNSQKTVRDLPPKLREGSTTTVAKLSASIALWAINTSAGTGQGPGAGSICPHKIPSWTVCWTCDPAPIVHLGGAYEADTELHSTQPFFLFQGTMLVTRGIVIDKIVSVSASNLKEADDRYPMNRGIYQNSGYGSLEETRNAFWRTIVGDTTAEGSTRAPESYSWLLEPSLWQKGALGVWTYGFGLHHFMERNKYLRLCGYTLEELIFGLNKWSSRRKLLIRDNFYGSTESQREALSWAVNAMAWRRVFGTEEGRMGMGTCAAEIGDSIMLLRGCNTPLILRESERGWRLVGDCYVHGVMYGEVSAEEHELVEITIQ